MTLDQIPEHERRVVHVISEPGSGTLREVRRAREVFWKKRIDHKFDYSGGSSTATHLFDTLGDAEYFGSLLDQRDIPFSYHPAKDYKMAATIGMSDHESDALQNIL